MRRRPIEAWGFGADAIAGRPAFLPLAPPGYESLPGPPHPHVLAEREPDRTTFEEQP